MGKPFLLSFQPGTQRDGTNFDGNRYIDALWCRWRLGKPRKMGGYRTATDALAGMPRRMHGYYLNGKIYFHIGTTNGIQQVVVDQYGNLLSVANRTPATFSGGMTVGFTFDVIFDTTSNIVQLVAHCAQNILAVSDDVQTTPFIGQIDSPTPLAPFSNPAPTSGVWTQPSVSGGVVCVQPFVFDFDSSGLVQWSAPNLPLYLGVTGGNSGAGQARISGYKVVAGMPLRGGGVQSPAAVFWSQAEVITATFVGTTSGGFAFNTVSPSSSILSPAGPIEYDGLYFWPGVDRFMVFNGIVNEVPNTQNQDWFFNNLTPGYEQLTYGFKVPRYGEIWWCACMFGSSVPNYAIIYNLRENAWYDTPLPNGGRAAAYFAQGTKYPFMCGAVAGANGYRLWQHEAGVDDVDGVQVNPVRSFFETGLFGGPKNDPPDDRGLSFHQLEPDIERTGDMIIYAIGQPNANAPEHAGTPVPLLQIATTPQEEFVSFTERQSLRLMRLHVESNVPGGDYICGRNIGHADPSEARLMS